MAVESFNGRLALITGGSSGIGLELAKLLVQEGARVWLVARRKEVLEQVRQSAPFSSDHRTEIYSADVTDWKQVQAAVDHVIREAGVPDLLVNAAGASRPGYIQETTLETYHEMMDLNYFGIVHTVQAILPHMIKRGSGYIVNFASVAGFMAPFGYAAYVPSKYAVRGFSDSLRLELKPLGIRVSVVFPPDTDTPGMANENKTKPFETLDAFSSKLVSPDEVAKKTLRGMKRGRYVILPGTDPALYYSLMHLVGNGIYPIFDMLLAQARRKKSSS
jgi:3-dehydrosphinganine reductase